jgi:hypothetical protein
VPLSEQSIGTLDLNEKIFRNFPTPMQPPLDRKESQSIYGLENAEASSEFVNET